MDNNNIAIQAIPKTLQGVNTELKQEDATPEIYSLYHEIIKFSGEDRLKVFERKIDKLSDGAQLKRLIFACDPTKKQDEPSIENWPKHLGDDAYHGLAGEVVRAISPYSEADDTALLINFLVAFGNNIGRGPFFVAGADRHYTNLFAALVGQSSKGRKGMSWGWIQALFVAIDERWAKYQTPSGLSSGEGLIWAVRDPIIKKEPIKEQGVIIDYQNIVQDEGVEDKRLMIIEAEFSSALKVMSRNGNTLSSTVRQAWDTGRLLTLVKNNPAKATDAHVSIIGHITKDELTTLLTNTEMVNGFGNRFLWVCVKRSKCLPDGDQVPQNQMNILVSRTKEAIDFAKNIGEIKRDGEARRYWHEIYPDLSEGKPGLCGALIARAEAQLMRLACIYALSDFSELIRIEHLKAALAVWRYCEESVYCIFGEQTGNPIADNIYKALRSGALTKTEINNLFKGHQDKESINKALALLEKQNKIEKEIHKTSGRSVEKFKIK